MHDNLVQRGKLIDAVRQGLDECPIVVLLGARQVGKTTLARMFSESWDEKVVSYDLETTAGWRAMSSAPEQTLSRQKGLVIVDEVQVLPELFRILRPLADRPDHQTRFLLLGSASLDLVKGVSESLAGRARYVHVPGLSLSEVGVENLERLWIRGGFPRPYLSEDSDAAHRLTDDLVQTLLTRDLPQLGIRVPAPALMRFWTICAHYHGQVLNVSELARALNVTPRTGRHYLDILSGAFMLRQLQPWHENLKKRQVKSPKLYLRDSGLLHHFLQIPDLNALDAHPKRGFSWEGFALEQILIRHGNHDAWFWNTHRGAELDLMLLRGGKRWGFEFKASDAPSATRSMHIAIDDLRLDGLRVVYPGAQTYALGKNIEVVPLAEAIELSLDG